MALQLSLGVEGAEEGSGHVPGVLLCVLSREASLPDVMDGSGRAVPMDPWKCNQCFGPPVLP